MKWATDLSKISFQFCNHNYVTLNLFYSNHYKLAVPRSHSTLGDRAFSIYSSIKWNALPAYLKLSFTHDNFKRHLKTFLFKQAFVWPLSCFRVLLMSNYISTVFIVKNLYAPRAFYLRWYTALYKWLLLLLLLQAQEKHNCIYVHWSNCK